MKALLTAEGVTLKAEGSALDLCLQSGQSACLMGPAGAGKSRLLRVLSGEERSVSGLVKHGGALATTSSAAIPKRATPNTLTRQAALQQPSRAAEALHALKLWEVRNTPCSSLSQASVAAVRAAGTLASQARVLVFDLHLDGLDPWALKGSLALLRARLGSGSAVLAATHRADVAAHFDLVIVIRSEEVRFVGPPQELALRAGPFTSALTYRNGRSARQITPELQLDIEGEGESVRIAPGPGHETAVKLLLAGYGDVSAMISRPPTLEEGLESLLNS